MGDVFDRLRRQFGPALYRARPPWADVALAAALTVLAIAWARRSGQDDAPQWPVRLMVGDGLRPGVLPMPMPEPDGIEDESVGGIVNVIAALSVAWRRRLPFTAFTVAIGSVFLLEGGLQWTGFMAILICAYSAVAYGRSLLAAGALLASAAVIAASMFSRTIPSMPDWLGPFVVLGAAGLGAAALRNARARADAAAHRAEALEQEQAATARAAIAEERARIARDLHDVVSHHVSVMVIQAGAAGKVIDQKPELARDALGAIETSGREAMAELRHLLGLVAPADDRLHPQPGLGDLANLIDSVRAAGQPVTLRTQDIELPHGADLTAYRVVQEGLTNALRYAPGAATAVDIRRDGSEVVVEVRNAAAPEAPEPAGGAGRGLIGLAERLRLHDGSLDTHRPLAGGFRLTARIPAVSA
jgi:signal transduction histidine kinase